jgi:hypothetical protein
VIETVLTAHPDIAHATVVAREGQPGGTRLVGYVVTANGNGCRSDSLREDPRRCLSSDLMTAPLIMLDAVAVKPDGKNSCCASCSPGCWVFTNQYQRQLLRTGR